MKPFGYHIPWQQVDPYALLVAAVDDGFMRLYAHVRRNARRITRICVTLLPLVMLLVSSCKTADTAATGGGLAAALFPGAVKDRPAAGYVSIAQGYVAAKPAALASLTGREVSFLLGKPALARKDADARVWQYRAKSCIVDVYFYENDGPVSYVDVRLKDAPVARNAVLPEKMRAKCLGRVMDEADFSGPSI